MTSPPAPAPFEGAVFSGACPERSRRDGDGKRVKSVINGLATTYFVGAHYEVTGGVITKYYYAGTQRIAMRTGGTLNYLLGDHLGSTSLVTDASGNNPIEMRYTAWGEVRFANGTTPTKYTYTGQYSYAGDFGLMFYNARWYDPSLGRFNQPDTIIPEQSQGVQAWDRYGYTNSNPVRYTDPTGHMMSQGCGDDGKSACYEDDPVIRNYNAARQVELESEADNRKCAAGNRNYCSGWDNWAWKNIPSSVGVQAGGQVQLGLGIEGSYSVEGAVTFNWRSGQIAISGTTEPGAYFGTPHGISFSGYGGSHKMYGISDLGYQEGPDAFVDVSLEADGVAQAGISVEGSQSLTESGGPQFIDPVSQMPQTTIERNATFSWNAIPNGVDGGLTTGESNTHVFKIFDLYNWFE